MLKDSWVHEQETNAGKVVRLLESESGEAIEVAIGAMLRFASRFNLDQHQNIFKLSEAGALSAVGRLLKSAPNERPPQDEANIRPSLVSPEFLRGLQVWSRLFLVLFQKATYTAFDQLILTRSLRLVYYTPSYCTKLW